MKLKITGSGGCVSTPKPCCTCPVCVEARVKGFPYARTGCSLYIEDAKILIDTPEDINYGLNHANVTDIETILYSHSDPDHTMGMRLLEHLRMNWLACSVGKKNENPIEIVSLPNVIKELKAQSTCKGSVLEYYVSCNLAKTEERRCLDKGNIHITLVPVDDRENVVIFVIEQAHKKVIYAPCDVKPFPECALFEHADLLIIGNTIIGDKLKGGFEMKEDNPLRRDLFSMDEIMALKERYQIKEVVMTHIEEDWGKSYDDYLQLEKQYDHVRFAYDGMELEISDCV